MSAYPVPGLPLSEGTRRANTVVAASTLSCAMTWTSNNKHNSLRTSPWHFGIDCSQPPSSKPSRRPSGHQPIRAEPSPRSSDTFAKAEVVPQAPGLHPMLPTTCLVTFWDNFWIWWIGQLWLWWFWKNGVPGRRRQSGIFSFRAGSRGRSSRNNGHREVPARL